MSKINITKFYRRALQLGGMSVQDTKKYTFHGTKRAHVTFTKNFGNAVDGSVALGTKHAKSGNVPRYNDASRSQLSKPALFQAEVRDKMRAVVELKEYIPEEKLESIAPNTPTKVPGEVSQVKNAVSPTEVHCLNDFLMSKGITNHDLREAGNIKSGASALILNLAAQLALGKQVRKPRFGKMGSIVAKLGLFDDEKENNPVAKLGFFDDDKENNPMLHNKILNTYNAPVQVFNGPVYFGTSNQSFQQMMVKRSAQQAGSSSAPKRQRLDVPRGTHLSFSDYISL